MFQPGGTVEVKYDPLDRSRVAITGVVQGQAPGMAGGSGVNVDPGQIGQLIETCQKRNAEIAATGLIAPATIVQCTPMGVRVNGNNPAVNLLVGVGPSGAAAFTAQAQGIVIAEASVPKYQPEKTITVRYDPSDPTRVAVERSGG